MSEQRERSDRDPHRRFEEWLLAMSEEDPPRDLAVHASVCSDCQRQIAALDMLTGIGLENAGMPPARAGAIERRIGVAGRVAVAMGGVAAVAAIGVGGWRLVEITGIGAPAGESPTQEVLGNTGQPQATLEASPSGELSAPPSPSASPSPSANPPLGATPVVTPVTLPPAATIRPTSAPTRTPRPTAMPPSPTPTPVPPTSTPTLTPEATPTPTPEETPIPEAEAA